MGAIHCGGCHYCQKAINRPSLTCLSCTSLYHYCGLNSLEASPLYLCMRILTAYAEHRTSHISTYFALQSSSPVLVSPSQCFRILPTPSAIMKIKPFTKISSRTHHPIDPPCIARCNISVCLCLLPHVSHRRPQRNDLSMQPRSCTIF
jgi:hypothetical protein